VQNAKTPTKATGMLEG